MDWLIIFFKRLISSKYLSLVKLLFDSNLEINLFIFSKSIGFIVNMLPNSFPFLKEDIR